MGALLPGQAEFATTTKQFVVRNIWHSLCLCCWGLLSSLVNSTALQPSTS